MELLFPKVFICYKTSVVMLSSFERCQEEGLKKAINVGIVGGSLETGRYKVSTKHE